MRQCCFCVRSKGALLHHKGRKRRDSPPKFSELNAVSILILRADRRTGSEAALYSAASCRQRGQGRPADHAEGAGPRDRSLAAPPAYPSRCADRPAALTGD